MALNTRHRLLLAFAAVLVPAPQLVAQLAINEILATNHATSRDDDGDTSDWVELVNRGADAVNLAGYAISDDRDDLRRWVLPTVIIEPGGYALIWCSGKDRRSGPSSILASDSTTEVVPRWVLGDTAWSYLTEPPESQPPPSGWQQPDFDSSAWPTGQAGFGYGVGEVRTHVPENHLAVFLRTEFTVENPQEIPNLIAEAYFDDALRLYLNGTAVASVNLDVPDEELTFATLGQGVRNARLRSRFDFSERRDLLVPGRNVLAAAVFNVRRSSRDLYFELALGTTETVLHTDFKLSSGGEGVFLSSPEGRLVDGLIFPEQVPDQSYARSPDGDGPFLYHLEPTPLARNSGPVSSQPLTTEPPEFSIARGHFQEPFELVLTAPPGASLRYTLDGSKPTAVRGEPYTGPLSIAGTTTVRAVAYRPEARASDVTTHSYVFIADVIEQPELEPFFVEVPWRRAKVERALRSAPALMISSTGGLSPAETPVSVEFLPVTEEQGFQADAGARFVGGHSLGAYPKKMIRLYFRTRYGGALDYPVFASAEYGAGAADEFEQLQLHSGAHDSVFYLGALQQTPADAQYLRNVWMSDMQFEMGRLSLHTRFVHVFLNGTYWGHFHITERPTPAYFASYLGGSAEDYEATNAGRETVGGPTPGWEALKAVRQDYPQVERYMDVGNFIDYMILQYYAGNAWDWNANQNWMAGGPSLPDRGGYRFLCWDSDIIFRSTTDSNLDRPGPQGLLASLRASPEFEDRFVSRVQELLSGDGLLTPGRAAEHYQRRASEIVRSLPAEPARWQATRRWTVEAQWEAEKRRLLEDFFPRRTGIVLDQLRLAGLFPQVGAPRLHPDGGVLEAGTPVFLSSATPVVYYTLDGTDPRTPEGGVSATARRYEFPVESVIDSSSSARYLVPRDGLLGLDWTARSFDDRGWREGVAAIGFERHTGFEEFIGTDVGDEVFGERTSVYVRVPFELSEPDAALGLQVTLRYDDGVLLYVNGVLVLHRNTQVDAGWDGSAERSRADSRALTPETVLVEAPLVAGENVLAAHVLNARASNRDLLFLPELAVVGAGSPLEFSETTVLRARSRVDEGWSPVAAARFLVGTPLVISEIMYHPVGDGSAGPMPLRDSADYEFIELRNLGSGSIDLAGVRLGEAVEFVFSSGHAQLGGGDTILVVSDAEAFQERYPSVPESQIAGEFSGRLSNAQERLVLVAADGRLVFEVEYHDEWSLATDGRGHSLVLFDEDVPPLDPMAKRSWRASRAPGGSPGILDRLAEGRRVPGDMDQNGTLNLADGIALLRRLFTSDTVTLPCGDELSDRGNRALLDVDSDEAVNIGDVAYILRFLFQRGPGPAAGLGCQRIVDCSDACGE